MSGSKSDMGCVGCGLPNGLLSQRSRSVWHGLHLQDLRDFLLTGQVPSSAPEIVKEASKATKASKASSKATKAAKGCE